MANSVAAALNTLVKEMLTLPRKDEEQLQLFIADFSRPLMIMMIIVQVSITIAFHCTNWLWMIFTGSDEDEHLAPDQHYSSNS